MLYRPDLRNAPAVAALIATRGRFDLLERAVESILAQTCPPERLVIVVDLAEDDLPEDDLATRTDLIQQHCSGKVHLTILRNRRTRNRAAGAWNTGLDHLHRDVQIVSHADHWFVAILDDDDSWEPDHIEACLAVAIASGANMVASGLIRHERSGDPGHFHSIPQTLNARQQFISGQHIQGSNLFVRLDLLLMSGMFDEHLPSCTDRDLCIRLAALPILRFGSTSRHTVHHIADSDRERLSTPESPPKQDGLTRFWHKHEARFDETAHTLAAERALSLFGWRLPSVAPVSIATPPPVSSRRTLSLVCGFVTDATPREHVRNLLEDLLALKARPDISDLTVVIVENGPIPGGGVRPLHDMAAESRVLGLDIDLITIEQQRQEWTAGRLIDTPDPTRRRMPIAASRTVLNTFVAVAASRRPGSAAWILDDDKRLSIRIESAAGVEYRPTPDIGALIDLRGEGVDVVIGPDTDAAPLPFTATVRMQLIDLERLLAECEMASPGETWRDRHSQDLMARAALPDFHYDLSRHTEHLETPLSPRPPTRCSTLLDAMESLAAKVDRLTAGEAITRPLSLDPHALAAEAAIDCVQRGGSTIFFHPEHLLEFPQTIARLRDRFVRRSDMLTATLMRDLSHLRSVKHASAGVRHDRSYTDRCRLEDETLWEDVLGYALHRATDELLQRRSPDRRRGPLLAWSMEELDQADRLVRKYVEERLAAFTLSAWRIAGLVTTIRSAAQRLLNNHAGWSLGTACTALSRITEEMDRLAHEFKPCSVLAFAKRIRMSISSDDVRDTFASMDGLINEYRATRIAQFPGEDARMQAREQRARQLLFHTFNVHDLQLLGAGGEGVVFTDGHRVFKVLDLLKRRPGHDTVALLQALCDRLTTPNHLYRLEQVGVHDGTPVVVYPFEESLPYTGGHGTDLLGLLRECRDYGVVFRNMHPRNLRVTATGLKLIDYGSDFRPFSEEGFRAMAERAWLTWRWAHRPDLDQVMRRALHEKNLPELDGFARFWKALTIERPSATHIVADAVVPLVVESGAGRVLDYGCGRKAHVVRLLAESRIQCVGFDPGAEMHACWEALGDLPPGLVLTTDRDAAMGAGPFDAVVCSLVLCELGDGPAYEQVLQDLSRAARPGARVIIAICHPHATFGGPTRLHRRRELPAGASYDQSFWYIENAESNAGRREYYRPLEAIERGLLRHGLRVQRRIASDAVDTERFEPATDFLILECVRDEAVAAGPTVSLLIRTCAMEAGTIERQVRHIVTQLERPRPFNERILVIDSLQSGFVRQHAEPDYDGVVAAADRLRALGLIDRILIAPTPGPDAGRVMREWFAIDTEATHSVAGAPLAATLQAIEQCQGEYILQVDSDIMVHRATHADDFLGEMIQTISERPQAVTASLSVPQEEAIPFSTDRDGVPWRVEVRACLLHRGRLLAARPLLNSVTDGRPVLSWHRSLDQVVRQGRLSSLRGGSAETAFVHLPNDAKRSVSEWMLLLDLIENHPVPAAQIGKVDLVGGHLLWVPRNRAEPVIFVITGRNVPPGRLRRCLESMAAQRREDWGAVIIDDASCTLVREALRLAIEPWRDRITLIQPRERRGQLANMTLAIRHVCTNPQSVIVTLDLDDALLGEGALDRVLDEYARGAEVTVGAMLRTDRHVKYLVDLEAPRASRGGNVWQHLRSFRKYLFDALADHELRVDGRYAEIAVDWSFMLPIVEMAERKAWIRDPVYLYEPSGLGKGADRVDREIEIAAIVAKAKRRPLRSCSERAVLLADSVTEKIWGDAGGILLIRHGERTSFSGLSHQQRDAVRLTEHGRAQAAALGRRLGPGLDLVSSPLLRAMETAHALASAAGGRASVVRGLPCLLEFIQADRSVYEAVKSRLSWAGLMHAWMDGSIDPGVLIPCADFAVNAVREVAAAGRPDGGRIVAVSHDFLIMASLATFRGVRTTAVPYLGGLFLSADEVRAIGLPEGMR